MKTRQIYISLCGVTLGVLSFFLYTGAVHANSPDSVSTQDKIVFNIDSKVHRVDLRGLKKGRRFKVTVASTAPVRVEKVGVRTSALNGYTPYTRSKRRLVRSKETYPTRYIEVFEQDGGVHVFGGDELQLGKGSVTTFWHRYSVDDGRSWEQVDIFVPDEPKSVGMIDVVEHEGRFYAVATERYEVVGQATKTVMFLFSGTRAEDGSWEWEELNRWDTFDDSLSPGSSRVYNTQLQAVEDGLIIMSADRRTFTVRTAKVGFDGQEVLPFSELRESDSLPRLYDSIVLDDNTILTTYTDFLGTLELWHIDQSGALIETVPLDALEPDEDLRIFIGAELRQDRYGNIHVVYVRNETYNRKERGLQGAVYYLRLNSELEVVQQPTLVFDDTTGRLLSEHHLSFCYMETKKGSPFLRLSHLVVDQYNVPHKTQERIGHSNYIGHYSHYGKVMQDGSVQWSRRTDTGGACPDSSTQTVPVVSGGQHTDQVMHRISFNNEWKRRSWDTAVDFELLSTTGRRSLSNRYSSALQLGAKDPVVYESERDTPLHKRSRDGVWLDYVPSTEESTLELGWVCNGETEGVRIVGAQGEVYSQNDRVRFDLPNVPLQVRRIRVYRRGDVLRVGYGTGSATLTTRTRCRTIEQPSVVEQAEASLVSFNAYAKHGGSWKKTVRFNKNQQLRSLYIRIATKREAQEGGVTVTIERME